MRMSRPLLVLATVLALAACGKKPEEPPVANDTVIEEPENVPAPPPVDEPPAAENSAKAVENRIAPPQISEEQQMQDDAEATGMTTRLPNEDSAPASADGGTH